MPYRKIAFSSNYLLRALESHVRAGSWTWNFATDEHRWSAGLYHLLGLEPYSVPPSYDEFYKFVHPEDRNLMPSSADIKQGWTPTVWNRRLITSDGIMKHIRARSEIQYNPAGIPIYGMAVIFETTTVEKLSRTKISDRRDYRSLASDTDSFMWRICADNDEKAEFIFSIVGDDSCNAPNGWNNTSFEYFKKNLFADIVRSTRISKTSLNTSYCLAADNGKYIDCKISAVKTPELLPRIVSWFGVATVMTNRTRHVDLRENSEGVELFLNPEHFRSARALLGHSIHDLALRSNVSISSIRRIENGDGSISPKTKKLIARFMMDHGITFLVDHENRIFLSKYKSSDFDLNSDHTDTTL